MENNNGHILIIDDDTDVLNAARLLLKQGDFLVDLEPNPLNLKELLQSNRYDALMLDMNFTGDNSSGEEGFHWLNVVRELDPALSVILITAYGDIEKAVKAMKNGAVDFVLKPWQNEKLLATVHSSARLTRSRREVTALKNQQQLLNAQLGHKYQEMIGLSKPMQKVFQTIEKVATTDANVLILGENGTGKELVARALHQRSNRKNKIFISVDLGALTGSLFESELFGSNKGAFTDAKTDKPGRLEIASGGTLFLDEIGNLPPSLQPKLLSVLETRTITRLGSVKPIQLDFRLISATNGSLSEMVENNQFRQDLLYRINTIEIRLPALRERQDDIPLLANYFLKKYTAKYKKQIDSIEPSAMEQLHGYNWPGNVRELEHTIERAVILAETSSITKNDFPFSPGSSGSVPKQGGQNDSGTLTDLEKSAIEHALKIHQGNISRTAEQLGLTRASLYRRMEKYGF